VEITASLAVKTLLQKPATNARAHTEELARRVRSLVTDYLRAFPFFSDGTLFFERIERLAALLAFWGARINLTAAPRDPREVSLHIIDSLAPIAFSNGEALLHHAFDAGNQVLDLGSGAGFPGLVLASASPASFTLLESRSKRVSFLAIAAAEMGLKNVVIESRRIDPEEVNPERLRTGTPPQVHGHFDVVTARAYAPPSIFHSTAASALKPGGLAILYANPPQNLDLQGAAQKGLEDFRRIAYTIPRSHRPADRILALWRRTGPG
jgi:16S rRNA (guanine527-N7)-methyltransferase